MQKFPILPKRRTNSQFHGYRTYSQNYQITVFVTFTRQMIWICFESIVKSLPSIATLLLSKYADSEREFSTWESPLPSIFVKTCKIYDSSWELLWHYKEKELFPDLLSWQSKQKMNPNTTCRFFIEIGPIVIIPPLSNAMGTRVV